MSVLKENYWVSRKDGKPLTKNIFVLDHTDPLASVGLRAYALAIMKEGRTALANDLSVFKRKLLS